MNTQGVRGIEILRAKIDSLDRRVVAILVKRFNIVEKIGGLKKKAGLAVKDVKREKEILKRAASFGRRYAKSLQSVFRTIIKESRGMQK